MFSWVQESSEQSVGTRTLCVASSVLFCRKTVAEGPSTGLSTRKLGVRVDRALALGEPQQRDSFPFPHLQKSMKNTYPIWRIKCLGGNPNSTEVNGRSPSVSPGKNFKVLSVL